MSLHSGSAGTSSLERAIEALLIGHLVTLAMQQPGKFELHFDDDMIAVTGDGVSDATDEFIEFLRSKLKSLNGARKH